MLKIALSKGIIYKPSVDLLKKSGFNVLDLEQPGRRLVLKSADGISYIIARPADVPTYVEYGAADLGFAGKDALLEGSADVFELLDLGIGKCQFVFAGPKTGLGKGRRTYQQLGQMRIATKYPQVASDYLDKKGLQAEIITLRGSVELAPLTGLADMIIDLMTTGKTLAENNLEVVEKIVDCSARLIANNVSMRLKHKEIEDFKKRLKVKKTF